MAGPVVPTMSSAGSLASVRGKLEYLFYCFITSQESQSNLFKVDSMVSIIAHRSPDEMGTCLAIEDALNRVYGSYFDRVTVSVSPFDVPNQPGYWGISINLVAFEDGMPYSLDRAVTVDDTNNIAVVRDQH